MKKERVKTALFAFTYSYVVIFDTQFLYDKNKTKALKQLRQDYVILKPDKGNGIVLINKTEYNLEMKKLFFDRSKFKVIQKDPTLTQLKTGQNNVNTMFKRNEISEEEKKKLRPMAAQLGRAHGLPKTHKAYANLPSFRPIIDTTSTPYCNIGKFLSSLLQPLTHTMIIISKNLSMLLKGLDQYHPSYLTMITSLFLLMLNHYLPMCQLKRQSTSF